MRRWRHCGATPDGTAWNEEYEVGVVVGEIRKWGELIVIALSLLAPVVLSVE